MFQFWNTLYTIQQQKCVNVRSIVSLKEEVFEYHASERTISSLVSRVWCYRALVQLSSVTNNLREIFCSRITRKLSVNNTNQNDEIPDKCILRNVLAVYIHCANAVHLVAGILKQ